MVTVESPTVVDQGEFDVEGLFTNIEGKRWSIPSKVVVDAEPERREAGFWAYRVPCCGVRYYFYYYGPPGRDK